MPDTLNTLEEMLRDQPSKPPLQLWDPELSGEMDMLIKSDGSWWHEGGRIGRDSLVRLFASILRKEGDGNYYLLTPVEKWRIKVESAPLVAIDMDVIGQGSDEQQLVFTTNVGTRFCLSLQYPLLFDVDSSEPKPYIVTDHGLEAQLTRAVYYRLAELAAQEGEHFYVVSSATRFEVL